ncbi:hypothetical protein PG984_010076 [Apiospora sp. TS-2023a]
MQLHPLLVAGLGAVVVGAAPAPFVSSPVLTPQSCDDNPALLVLRGLDDVAAVCSGLAPPASTQTALSTKTATATSTETVTATLTETDSETATSTATAVGQATETSVVDGPTVIETDTITTVTSYMRDDGEFSLKKLKNKKKRDRCAAKPKSSYSASMMSYSASMTAGSTSMTASTAGMSTNSVSMTTSSAPSSTATSNPADALKQFADDVVAAACSCLASAPTVTDTVTVTTTVAATPPATQTAHVTVSTVVATVYVTVTPSTETQTATSTAPATTTTVTERTPAATPVTATTTDATQVSTERPRATVPAVGVAPFDFYFHLDNRCMPISNTREVFADVPDIPLTTEDIFDFCAGKCVDDPGCNSIWISYNTPVTRQGLWCITGEDMYQSAFQCRYAPIGQKGALYGR